METITLKLGKITGNSALKSHTDQIILGSFSFNIAMPVHSDPSGTERTVGRAQFGEMMCSKLTDLATPSLYRACAAGEKLGDATIVVSRTEQENSMELISYVLSDAMVSTIATSGGGQPMDSFSLSYSKITAVYTQQNKDSTQKGKASFGWDISTNTDAAPAAS
jgi:type VI secretion system secreted protein Hcp